MFKPDPSKLMKSFYTVDAIIMGVESSEVYFNWTNKIKVRWLAISDDFEKAVMPIVRVSLSLSDDERLTIQEHKNDILINLKVHRIEKSYDEELQSYQDTSNNVVFDLNFQIFTMGPESTHLSKEERFDRTEIEGEDQLTSNNPNAEMKETPMIFVLSCTNFRNRFKIPINFNHTKLGSQDATVAGAMALGISKCVTAPKSVVFQDPDNTENYTQITVPPFNLKDFCNYMQHMYGVYKTGLIVYQDLKYLYVIPKISKNFAVPEGEYNSVTVFIYGSEAAISGESHVGYYKDDDNSTYTLMQTAGYQVVRMDEYIRETTGSDYNVVSDKQIESSISYGNGSFSNTKPYKEYATEIKGASSNSVKKVRNFHDELDNEMNATELVENAKLLVNTFTMSFRDVDIDVFKYNRLYRMNINENVNLDVRFGGTYKMLTAEKIITRENGNREMNSKVSATFAKLE